LVNDESVHEKLKLAFAIYLQENEKFEVKGIKSSAVRARQALNDMKDLITDRRKEIQEKKSDL
jgi:hypothetical protein